MHSMIAKVIAHGSSRAEAVRKLRAALKNAPLLGLRTNQGFLTRLLQAPEFIEATLSTTSLDEWSQAGHGLFSKAAPSPETVALAAALFANGSKLPLTMELACDGEDMAIRYLPGPDGASILDFGDTARVLRIEDRSFPAVVYSANGVRRRAIAVLRDGALHLSQDGDCFIFTEKTAGGQSRESDADGFIRAPVAGRVAKVFVQTGDMVTAGMTLAVIEAMKMEIRVTSAHDGVVKLLAAIEGGQIAQGSVICEIEKAAQSHG